MSTIAIASQSDFAKDPRPYRMAQVLRQHFNVICLGYGQAADLNCDFIELPRRVPQRAPLSNRSRKLLRTSSLLASRYEMAYRSNTDLQKTLGVLSNIEADLMWVHDLDLLPLAIEAPTVRRVGFDIHEYFPAQYEESWRWRITEGKLQQHLVNRYAPMADVTTTVSQGLADKYKQDCGIEPTLVPSAANYIDLKPIPPDSDGNLRIIYHGKAHENRKIDELIRMAELLDDRFSMTFILVGGSPQYREKLEVLAASSPRVTLADPAPMTGIAAATNTFDIGLCAIPATTFNLKHCLPNKLFEMLQARLAIVTWPSPDIARLVRQHKAGVVAESYDIVSLAAAINSLESDQVYNFKKKSNSAAKLLSFEASSDSIISLTHQALTRSAAAA